MSSNDDKRLQAYDKIATYPYGCSVGKVFDEYTNENKIEYSSKWPYIPDHPYRILIIGGSGSGKINVLLNLINNQSDINKIYLHAKGPYEEKYQYLINKCEKVGLKHFNDPKLL